MGTPWNKANPGLLKQIREDLIEHYPTLHAYEEGAGIVVRGTFPIELPDVGTAERFHITIVLPPGYPKVIPTVFETKGRIPWKPDRHMGEHGAACLFVPEEYRLKYPAGQRFLEFLQGSVRDYFLAQLVFERDNVWPFGQRPHGVDGRHEFFKELLGLPESRLVHSYLSCLAIKDLKGHIFCPCGSGKRIRECHWNEVQLLRARVPRRLAQEGLDTRQVAPARPPASVGSSGKVL